MKIQCINKSCDTYQTEREIEWNGFSSSDLYLKMTCPACGHQCETILSEEKDEAGLSSIGVGRIAGMTPAEKKVLLKKRSNEHYKREIKGRKEYLDRAAIGLEKS